MSSPARCLLLLAVAGLPLSAHAAPPEARTDAYGDPLPPGARYRLGTVRMHQPDPVGAPVWSPDGKLLAMASSGGAIHLWEVPSGKELRRLVHPDPTVVCLAFSPDGRFLAAAGFYGDILLWDPTTGKEVRRLGDQQFLAASVVFSSDAKTLAAGGFGRCARLFAVATGREVRRFETGTEHAVAVAFSPDGKVLVADDGAGGFFCWDTASGTRIPTGIRGGGEARLLVFSPDGKALALLDGGPGGAILVWSWPVGREMYKLRPEGPPFLAMAFSPDGKTLTTAEQDVGFRLWEACTGRELRHPRSGRRWAVPPINTLAFSPGGSLLASTSDGAIALWDLRRSEEETAPPAAGHRLGEFALLPGTSGLVTSAWDGSLVVHDLGSGQVVRRLEPWGCTACKLTASADGKMLIGWEGPAKVVRWDPTTGRRLPPFPELPPKTSEVTLSPDARTLALGGDDGTIRLWDAAAGKERRRIPSPPPGGSSHEQFVHALVWTADSRGLAVTWWRESQAVYNIARGRWVSQRPEHLFDVAFSPDARLLVGTNSHGEVIVSEVVSGQNVRRFFSSCRGIPTLAAAGDGRTVASGSPGADGMIHLFDLATGRSLGSLSGHRGPIHALAFSPDDTLLFSRSGDATVLCWDVAAVTGRPGPAAVELTEDQAATRWAILLGETIPAQQAVGDLVRSPRSTLLLLDRMLVPATAPPARRLAALIADLDSEDFDRRERASRELEELGDLAAPALRRALDGQPSPEARRRLERLLGALDGKAPTPEWLQAVRALQVLEGIGTPEARRVLARLAGGAAGAPLTEEAQAALRRLERRSPANP
jgi:WD40 repeat protein